MNIFRRDAIEKNPQLIFSFIGNIGKSEKKVVKDNWLGNVNVVISDKKIPVDVAPADGIIDYYTADVLQAQDYYPGGFLQPGRNFNSNAYRFGMNGQEKVNEIAPDHYTAEFWEYDPRTIRRWNPDPKPDASISFYNCFAGNPIRFSDILGDVPGEERLGPNGFPGVEHTGSHTLITRETANVYGTKFSVATDGMILNQRVTNDRISNLEKGNISSNVSGIILHRTVSSTGSSALNSFESRGVGTHFLVDKDGKITQAASLNKYTSHLRESQLKEGAPKNSQAIGIEVVGNYNEKTKQWDPVTKEQTKSASWLTNSLLKTYDLYKENISNHEDIQPKTAGEGKVVRDAIDKNLINRPVD